MPVSAMPESGSPAPEKSRMSRKSFAIWTAVAPDEDDDDVDWRDLV